MRRTYKSKKETGGALDHRDVLLTMDDKSSLFDAFYINHIKQTKREMSIVPSLQFAASNKVRKRKYVKRLKEQDPVMRESTSTSAFLTPDKSFRVNKAPDPFDQLLNSSNRYLTEQYNDKSTKIQKGKTYCRMKTIRKKKINYSSSDSTDSDKENSDSTENNATQNNSDILSHKLLVERENPSPKRDESIANVVKNLSLFKESKDKVSTSPRGVKHRITNLSNVSNSPLCSTPFLDKYRGKSIYRFSPISINLNDSASSLIISEGNNHNDVENSIVEVKDESNSYNEIKQETVNNTHELSCEIRSPILPHNTINGIPKTKTDSSNPLPEATLQTTEVEPFLGFTDTKVSNTTDLNTIADKCNKLEKDDSVVNGSVEVAQDYILEVNENSIHKNKVIDNEKQSNSSISSSHTNSSLESDENESFYGTCHSEDFDDDDEVDDDDVKQPIVVMERLNDSIFRKYYSKMPGLSITTHTRNSDVSNDVISDEYGSVDNESSVSSSSNSNNISKESIIDDEFFEDHTCEMSKDDLLQNDSLDSYSTLDVNRREKHDNISRESIKSDEICEEQTSQVGEDDHLHNHSSDRATNSDVTISDDEDYVSFVTTRRRKEFTNDSFILGLDNSVTSGTSADADKSVLNRDSIVENIEEIRDETLIEEKLAESNKEAKNIPSNNIVQGENSIDISKTVSIPPSKGCNISTRNEKSINRTSFKLRKSSKSPKESDTSTNIEINLNISNKMMTRRSVRLQKQSIGVRSSLMVETSKSSLGPSAQWSNTVCDLKQGIVLQPGKRWERSLSIYRRMTTMSDHFDSSILDDEPLNKKGRKYRQSVISTMEMQDYTGSLHNDSINSRRSTFVSKPSRSTIRIVRDTDISRSSLCSTSVHEDSQGFLTEDCDDTIVELSKLSIADSEHEVTVLENFHDTPNRFPTARDYVLRRCNQTDIVLFDECYPDTTLKNCRKIGEGVYGEVFLWRAGDGKARVLKIIPIAGNIKVNGENQKDYHEIISEIVIAMELSALRAPIDDIDKHFNEGKSIETLDLHSVVNATDVFNEVLAVRCVYGTYPSRLLDLWDLYDECKGSENDNPAILPIDQQYIVLELANAGQDLESYQFNNAEQAYALFKQVAFGLAVAEEAYQFEHRDLHWGNVLISPTDQKYATFVVRGRVHRVSRRGVRAALIDYSLSRAALRLPGGQAELYNDLAADDSLFDAVGDYQFEVYRLMRDKLGNDWKNFEPYTNILWLHYTVDKMITSLRYSRTNTKIHKHYIAKLKEIKNRILDYGSAVQYVLTDNDL